MPLSVETPLHRRWIVWSAILAVALTAFGHVWLVDRHLTFVASVQRPDYPIHTPLQRVRPGYTADVSMWIRYALARLEGKEGPRSHHTDVDNPPHGREVHWNSGLVWWLAGCGWAWHECTGTPLPAAVEHAAVWANLPLLLGFVIGFGWWAARRAGAAAGVLGAMAMIGHRSIYEGFTPAYPDHHGLIAAATLGLLLGALFMGGGWWRGADAAPGLALLPADERRARSAAAWAGFWGGFGLWISTASLAIPIAMMALAGLLAGLACHRSLTAEGARFSGTVWRTWGRVGALTSLGFYLLEYFPSHLGWRLEVNHPLYAAAWWAGAEFTAGVLEWLIAAPATRTEHGRALLRCGTWALPLALAPLIVIAWRGAEVFGLLDPFMARLHTSITEFMPFSARIAMGGIEPFFDLLLIHPLLYIAVPLVLWRCGKPARFGVLLTVVPALAIQGLALWQSRWSASGGSAQLPLLLALLAAVFAGRATPFFRWGLSLLAITVFYVPFIIVTATGLAVIMAGNIVPKDETSELLYREIAQVIRDSQPEGPIVLFASPNASLSIGYYGRFRTLGTLYWENGEGLKAAAALNCAPTEEAAEAIVRRLGVTHIATLSADNYVAEYAALLHPGITPAELERTFGYQLLVKHHIPPWLEPLPYRPPRNLPDTLASFDALLFKVNFTQTEAEQHSRLAKLLALRGQTDDALGHLAEAALLTPGDPTPWLRRGEILLGKSRWVEAAENFDRGIALGSTAEQYKLLTQAAIAFEQSRRYPEAIAYYRRALAAPATNDIALNNLAWRLATTKEDALRDPLEALGLAKRAVTAAPADAGDHDTLAAAYAANGRFTDAVSTAEKAVALAKAAGDGTLAKSCEKHLAAYHAGRPWRE